MLTLYYKPGACSLASHIALEWIGRPYEAMRVDPASEAFRAINPAGAVPALRREDGSVLTQSSAVLKYLARAHPKARLADADEGELDRWSAFLTGDLHPAFFPYFRPDRYTTAEAKDERDRVKTAAIGLVSAKVALLELRLGASKWIAGEKRTYVDAYAFPMLRWARAVLPGGLQPFPSLFALFTELTHDEAVQAVMRAEGLN